MRAAVLALLVTGCVSSPSELASAADPGASARVACDVTVPAQAPTVQAGLDATPDGGTLCVSAGTFTENLTVDGRDIAIVGSGAGRTVLDGGGVATTVDVMQSTLSLASLTVSHGAGGDGGGIRVESSTLDLAHVTVADNLASVRGGGMYVLSSTVTADDVRVLRNESALTGGGISVGLATFTGHDLLVARNVSYDYGGAGLSSGSATTVVTNSAFLGNEAWGTFSEGGGIKLDNAGSTIENVLVAGNFSENAGGGVATVGYQAEHLTNVAILDNHAGDGGAVHSAFWGGNLVLDNAVIVGNRGDKGVGGILTYGVFTMTWSDLWGNAGLAVSANQPSPIGKDGNVAVDPMFVSMAGHNPARWDLHLQPGSPAIDAGDPALLDPDGTRSDMGLYGGPGAE